jgi:hypothetical protein
VHLGCAGGGYLVAANWHKGSVLRSLMAVLKTLR